VGVSTAEVVAIVVALTVAFPAVCTVGAGRAVTVAIAVPDTVEPVCTVGAGRAELVAMAGGVTVASVLATPVSEAPASWIDAFAGMAKNHGI
jgi:hypothetical protein